MVRAGHFTWSNYQSLLEKAKRDLDLLNSRPEHPEDVIFNLVVTIDHIFDWAKADSSLDSKTHQAALALRKSDSAVAVINQLSVGANHETPNVTAENTPYGAPAPNVAAEPADEGATPASDEGDALAEDENDETLSRSLALSRHRPSPRPDAKLDHLAGIGFRGPPLSDVVPTIALCRMTRRNLILRPSSEVVGRGSAGCAHWRPQSG